MKLLVLAYCTTAVVVVTVFGAPHPHQSQLGQSPPRIFGNKNALRITGNDEEKEELELESLKGNQNPDKTQDSVKTLPKQQTSTFPPTTTSTHATANVKRPENEETPAISDNANSLKFPHHNPDGFDESLFSKKNHISPSLNVEEPNAGFGFGFGDLDRISAARVDHLNPNFQIDYTPQDIAEYIFWTGDERGVASAIGDFLQEGMVNREDAVRFLEDVKTELFSIRARYASSLPQGPAQQQQQQQPNLMHSLNILNTPSLEGMQGYTAGFPSNNHQFHPSTAKRESYPQFPQYGPEITSLDSSPAFSRGQGLSPATGSNSNLLSVEELDYDEIAEKLRTVDAKMREYALEDVIYQIGKSLFAESLKNSKTGTQDSTQKFSSFIEAQSAGGKIPKDLEKDVLEVLVGAFVDAVDERGAQQAELEHQLQDQSAKQEGTAVKAMQTMNKSHANTNSAAHQKKLV